MTNCGCWTSGGGPKGSPVFLRLFSVFTRLLSSFPDLKRQRSSGSTISLRGPGWHSALCGSWRCSYWFVSSLLFGGGSRIRNLETEAYAGSTSISHLTPSGIISVKCTSSVSFSPINKGFSVDLGVSGNNWGPSYRSVAVTSPPAPLL